MHLPEDQFWKTTPKIILMLWNEYLKTTGQIPMDDEAEEKPSAPQGEIVYRNGKPYRKVKPEDAKWLFS